MKIWISALFLITIDYFFAENSFSNNLHEQSIRSIVAPYIESSGPLGLRLEPKSGLRLALSKDIDREKKITFRLEPLNSQLPAIPQEKGSLTPGIYDIVIFENAELSYRKKFVALAGLLSDLGLNFSHGIGYTIKQTINLPPLKFSKSKKEIIKESYSILAFLVTILREHPEISTLEIRVHTDSGGKETSNLELTQARAEQIKSWLLNNGIGANRLIANGLGSSQASEVVFGEESPLKNRRVEYVVECGDDSVIAENDR